LSRKQIRPFYVNNYRLIRIAMSEYLIVLLLTNPKCPVKFQKQRLLPDRGVACKTKSFPTLQGEAMKKSVFTAVAAVLCIALSLAFAASDDIVKHLSCKHCGVDREKFSHSRMLVEYEDSSSMGLCSLHCAAVELALNIDKMPKAIMVADYSTKALIDAEKAAWVVGGAKPGVMTRTPKWAFEKKADAEAFNTENGGELTSFDDAVKTAYADMYEDVKMIRDKRRMIKQKAMEHLH
jgi:copper chaperone NosL